MPEFSYSRPCFKSQNYSVTCQSVCRHVNTFFFFFKSFKQTPIRDLKFNTFGVSQTIRSLMSAALKMMYS